jgi:hypothetical protein
MSKGINCVKTVPVDGTEVYVYQWSKKLYSYAESFNCKGVILETCIIPKYTEDLGPTVDAHKDPLVTRIASSATMGLLRI